MVPMYKINKILSEIKKEGQDPDLMRERAVVPSKILGKKTPDDKSPSRGKASPSKLSEKSPSRPQSKYASRP